MSCLAHVIWDPESNVIDKETVHLSKRDCSFVYLRHRHLEILEQSFNDHSVGGVRGKTIDSDGKIQG